LRPSSDYVSVPPEAAAGQIVILNGAPRSGKTSIARALQAREERTWINLGVDASAGTTPERLRPGLGLRPGGERPDLEDLVAALAAALFDSIAAHARVGLSVVADVGLHDAYGSPRHLRAEGARRLRGLPVLFVGVRCPLDEIWARRAATWAQRREEATDETVRAVERWQEAVHAGHDYDLEVDTAADTPERSAERIVARLLGGPPGSAFWGPVLR
jgi:chloramphenicol 3-O phosphotransferase